MSTPVQEQLIYRADLIRGAMGARCLTIAAVAELSGVGIKPVTAIKNGDPNVKLAKLKAVVEALGLTLDQVFKPAAEGAAL